MWGFSLILPWKGFTLNIQRNFESSFLSDHALINVSPPGVLMQGQSGDFKYNLHPLGAHLVKSPLNFVYAMQDFTI